MRISYFIAAAGIMPLVPLFRLTTSAVNAFQAKAHKDIVSKEARTRKENTISFQEFTDLDKKLTFISALKVTNAARTYSDVMMTFAAVEKNGDEKALNIKLAQTPVTLTRDTNDSSTLFHNTGQLMKAREYAATIKSHPNLSSEKRQESQALVNNTQTIHTLSKAAITSFEMH